MIYDQIVDGARDISQRHAVNVGQPEDSRHSSSHSGFRFNMEVSAGALRGELEKRYPETDLAGGAGGEERVDYPLDLLFGHSAAVVLNDNGQRIIRVADIYLDGDEGSARPRGVFRHVQYI